MLINVQYNTIQYDLVDKFKNALPNRSKPS